MPQAKYSRRLRGASAHVCLPAPHPCSRPGRCRAPGQAPENRHQSRTLVRSGSERRILLGSGNWAPSSGPKPDYPWVCCHKPTFPTLGMSSPPKRSKHTAHTLPSSPARLSARGSQLNRVPGVSDHFTKGSPSPSPPLSPPSRFSESRPFPSAPALFAGPYPSDAPGTMARRKDDRRRVGPAPLPPGGNVDGVRRSFGG